jgi:2-keto-4-pentenoate hydratase/2-oxohepta-3-ene-1,7-dioic acid hydratase in catechol pathway
MQIACFNMDGEIRLGIVSKDEILEIDPGSGCGIADALDLANLEMLRRAPVVRRHPLASVAFRPMLAFGARVFCIGINYLKKHPIAGDITKAPEQPTIFPKLPESFIGHGESLETPKGASEQLDYEGELAVVIGRPGRNIDPATAYDHVFGYTVVNDGSVRDWQKHSLFSGKNFFRASSLGPTIVSRDEVPDPMNLLLTTRLNGTEVQRTNTSAMLFDVAFAIHHISRFTPLRPGDVIATGSPAGAGASFDPPRFLRPGDRLEFEIESVGKLVNTVS